MCNPRCGVASNRAEVIRALSQCTRSQLEPECTSAPAFLCMVLFSCRRKQHVGALAGILRNRPTAESFSLVAMSLEPCQASRWQGQVTMPCYREHVLATEAIAVLIFDRVFHEPLVTRRPFSPGRQGPRWAWTRIDRVNKRAVPWHRAAGIHLHGLITLDNWGVVGPLFCLSSCTKDAARKNFSARLRMLSSSEMG